jgi:carbon monoxide dehydrogenase subunit G
MATVYKEININAPADHVWACLRDPGAVHSRLAQQFVVDTKLEGDSRLVSFANGVTVRERIVTIDERRRRFVYAVIGWQASHHNGVFEVVPQDDGRTRLVWTADLLPDDLHPTVDELMEKGAAAIKRTLEATARAADVHRGAGGDAGRVPGD